MNKLSRLILLIILALVACAPKNPSIDSGLLTGLPCQAPCWQNLTPGMSSGKDVQQFLDNLSMIEWPHRRTFEYKTGCKSIRITDTTSNDAVGAILDLNIENEKLIYIESSRLDMFKLREIIDAFGTPEYFMAILAIGPDGDSYKLEIYYPQKGIAFHVSVDRNERGYINPRMYIYAVQYFAPGDLLSYFTTRYSCNLGREGALINAQKDIKLVQPWSGYGKINVIQTR